MTRYSVKMAPTEAAAKEKKQRTHANEVEARRSANTLTPENIFKYFKFTDHAGTHRKQTWSLDKLNVSLPT